MYIINISDTFDGRLWKLTSHIMGIDEKLFSVARIDCIPTYS